MKLRLALNLQSSCIHHNAGITGVHHHTQQRLLEDIQNIKEQEAVKDTFQTERNNMKICVYIKE
jgi:hypothetical protein